MDIEIVGGSYRGRSPNLNSQRCINLYPEIDQQEGKKVRALIGTPGLVQWCDLGTEVEIRAMLPLGSLLYVIGGNTLYKITTAGVATAITGTISTSTGNVYMDTDGTNIIVVEPGVEGYVYGGSGSLTAIADADFPTSNTLCVIDGYTITDVSANDQFYISALNDPTAWDASDYASAESVPGNLVRIFRANHQLLLLKYDSGELWYNSGASAFPFERVSGVFLNHGIGNAPNSIAQGGDNIFWLNQFRQVVMAPGLQTQIVSTPQVEYQFNTYSSVADARGFCYTQEGHSFYVLTFPTAGATWAYDYTTGFWHERQSYPVTDGEWGKHRANCFARFNNLNLVGDYLNGHIYYYDLGTYTEHSEMIRRVRQTQTVQQNRQAIFFHELELDMETGVGLITGQGSEPRVMLQYSDDGGHTWSSELWADIGEIGQYSTRVRWRRLGTSRSRIWQISLSDPVKTVILGANLTATLGVH